MVKKAELKPSHFDLILKRVTQILLCIVGFFTADFIMGMKEDIKTLLINDAATKEKVQNIDDKFKSVEKTLHLIQYRQMKDDEEDDDQSKRKSKK